LFGETNSQLPPEDVLAAGVKPKDAPVLAMVKTCGNGLAPPKGIVKSRAGIVWKVCAWSGAVQDNSAKANRERMSESAVPRCFIKTLLVTKFV
jgi:hypothetical protein